MIVEKGIAQIIDDIKDIMDTLIVSSASDAPAFSDTDIEGSVASVDTSSVTASNTTLTFQGVIDSTTATGNTLRKVAVKDSAGNLMMNDNHPDIEHTTSDEIRYLYKVTMKRGN